VKPCLCQICRKKLEPVQELRYLVEIQFLEEPVVLDRLRQLPDVDGKPLRVCKACQGSIEANPVGFRQAVVQAHDKARQQLRRQRSGMITAIGVLTVGWFFASLIGAPRV